MTDSDREARLRKRLCHECLEHLEKLPPGHTAFVCNFCLSEIADAGYMAPGGDA